MKNASATTDGRSDSPGPQIIRPIPRRPFNAKFSSPTPPEEDDYSSFPSPQISASDLRFLAPQNQSGSLTPNRDGTTPLSHTSSYRNLTSGTLYGIYSPSTTGPFDTEDDQDQDQYFPDATDTPIETPAPRPGGLDEETYRLMRSRASRESFSSSSFQSGSTNLLLPSSMGPSSSRGWVALLQLLLRAALLFVLGVGYGVLVTRLPRSQNCHHNHQHRHLAAYYEAQYEWRYLVFWGVAGVALGSLLPWFDRFWEASAAQMSRGGVVLPPPSSKDVDAPITEKPSASVAPQADWALVVRGIGAFVGIVFAIRKLPWASTMQVSLTLALVNPFLWYLIDRSKPGFLLSAAVGLAGSAVMMGLDPHAMPAPTTAAAAASASSSSSAASLLSRADNPAGLAGGHSQGLASQETIELSIWMLSVLFCSCVCFGNIGRRLALNSSAAGRGRWGGVR
ncbi:insulin-induced protein-domain-containing protein [Chaetomium strumarium]|uniref:Insulin-induced protein-domain-containing protein n=1 Tax=Chaetomium strumarium TaxID=1170767 RepID=A0AAJ0GKK8_9PEZI|nr:insulin-induced protein-domain-containing protein [Chaetomium strumarium]